MNRWPATPRRHPDRPAHAAPSILVVEDERIVALELAHQLAELGYRVPRTVARGEDAITATVSQRPDLVLMDVNIEGTIDGIEAAAAIRERTGTPVVFMTAYAEDDTITRAQASRPYGYLIKPYDTRELHATIRVALARHEADARLARSEARLRLALDAAGLRVWDWAPHAPAAWRALAAALPGLSDADRHAIGAALRDGRPVAAECAVHGGRGWIEVHARPAVAHDAVEIDAARAVGVVRDVTERHRADERLRQAAIVFERVADAILMLDAHRCIVSVNPAFVALTGWPADEAVGRDIDRLLNEPPHDPAFYAALLDSADGHWHGEVRLRRRDGDRRVALQSVSRVPAGEHDAVRWIVACSDLTGVRRAQEQLAWLAHHDVLTGLPNRARLDERLDAELQRARRLDHGIALMFIDLDGFKTINDSLGHAAGDRLLQELAQRLRASIRDVDTAARLGGDEFVVVMTDLAQPEDAAVLAGKLLGRLAEPVDVGGRRVTVSASIGVAVFPQDGVDRGALMMAADSAMYAAKAHGRDHVSFYTASLANSAHRRLDVEQGLRRSLERGELRLHFQPVLALADGRMLSAEVLLRWHRGDGAPVAPQQFVQVAEDSGLIESIGLFVLERTCEQVAAWRAQGLAPPPVSVNVSPRQLERGDFAGRLGDALRGASLPADRVEIEVTETALRGGAESLRQLDRIRGLGVRIAIDDFGTGYSSLWALKHLPLDRLKIDRSFVHDLPDDPDAQAIVQTIVAMSRSLGLATTAEGIETQPQLDALRRLGCEAGQGFLLGEPIDATAFAERLRVDAVAAGRNGPS